jgi:hypothetical protein
MTDTYVWKITSVNNDDITLMFLVDSSIAFKPGSTVVFIGENKKEEKVKALLKVKEVTNGENGTIMKCSKNDIKTRGKTARALKKENTKFKKDEEYKARIIPIGKGVNGTYLYTDKLEEEEDKVGEYKLESKKIVRLQKENDDVIKSKLVNLGDLITDIMTEKMEEDVQFPITIGGMSPEQLECWFRYGSPLCPFQILRFWWFREYESYPLSLMKTSNGDIVMKTDSIRGDEYLSAASKSGEELFIVPARLNDSWFRLI